jgi:hypothetical protein
MNQTPSRQFDDDQVTRIIRRALKLSDARKISHAELMDTARQIGLDSQVVEMAIKEEQRASKKQRIRSGIIRRRKAGFQRHLWAYLIVNAALILTNKLTPGPWWSHWSILGWGIGLAFHFKAVYFPASRLYGRGPRDHSRRLGIMACGK